MKTYKIDPAAGSITVGKATFSVAQVADALAHGDDASDEHHARTDPATAAAVLARLPGLGDEETVEAIRAELAKLRGG